MLVSFHKVASNKYSAAVCVLMYVGTGAADAIKNGHTETDNYNRGFRHERETWVSIQNPGVTYNVASYYRKVHA
jgi:hypothetical protein